MSTSDTDKKKEETTAAAPAAAPATAATPEVKPAATTTPATPATPAVAADAAKGSAAGKPASATKLSASSKPFVFSAKSAEFKPKFASPGGADGASPAGAGRPHPGNPNYNPGANEFMPGGPGGGQMGQQQQQQGMPPHMAPQMMAPNGMPLYWNPQVGQYIPMQFPPMMQGMPPQGYQQQPGVQGFPGQPGGPYPGQPQQGGGYHKGGPRGAPYPGGRGHPNAGGAEKPLPAEGAIRFGSLPPAKVEEPAPTAASAAAAANAAANKSAAAAAAAPAEKKAEQVSEPTAAAVAAAAAPTKADKAASDAAAATAPGGGKKELKLDSRWGRKDAAAVAATEGASPASSSGTPKDGEQPAAKEPSMWGKERLAASPANTVPQANGGGNAQQQEESGAGGWKRGAAMPIEQLVTQDGSGSHKRYDKQALLALFSKGKTCPAEIKVLYPDMSQQERVPLLPKSGRMPQGGGRGGGKNKQEDLEPHPDEAKIFDFTSKENTFTYQKDRHADAADPEVICSKANLILNKLSVTKFDKLSDEFMQVGLQGSDELLQRGVDIVVLKAQMEEHFCFMYADLCRKLTDLWSRGPEEGGNSDAADDADGLSLGKVFRQKLLLRCQEEFNVDRVQALADIRASDISAEDKEEKEILLKKRYTGHMRFIGELYLKDLVTAKIMHQCVLELLAAIEEETLVCLCKLLVTIGAKLEYYDKRKGHDNFNQYFHQINTMAKEHKSSRMRFMLRDLVDMRATGWEARREEERAMDINDIRKGSSGGGGSKGSPRNSSGDARSQHAAADEWSTVPSKRGGGGGKGSSFGRQDVRGSASGASRASPSANAFGALAASSSSNSGGRSSPSPKKAGQQSNWADGKPQAKPAKDAASSSSSTPASPSKANANADGLPGTDGKVAPELRLKARSIVSEYYMNDDAAEALNCFQELLHPNAMGEVIGAPKGLFDLVFDKFPTELSKLCALLESLHNEKFLAAEQVTVAVYALLDNFDETVIDTPKASEYGTALVAGLIRRGLFSLAALAAVPEDSMWHMSFRRAAFMGDLLTALVAKEGSTVDELTSQLQAAKLNVLELVSPGPKQSDAEARAEYLAKYAKLSFLSME